LHLTGITFAINGNLFIIIIIDIINDDIIITFGIIFDEALNISIDYCIIINDIYIYSVTLSIVCIDIY